MVEMTFQNIEKPAEPKPEHPAYRAAKMIRELHVQNIELIDGGQLFMKDGVDVSTQMRVACVEQIRMCDEIMARAENMDPKLWEPSALILGEIESTIAEAKQEDRVLASIPEVGNYDHEEKS